MERGKEERRVFANDRRKRGKIARESRLVLDRTENESLVGFGNGKDTHL